jgi:hypothetical protein
LRHPWNDAQFIGVAGASHEIGLGYKRSHGRNYAVAAIRLFATQAGPTYQVVAGESRESPNCQIQESSLKETLLCRAAWEDQAAVGCHKSGHCSRTQKRGDKMRRFLLSMVLLSCGMGSGWCETITVEQLRVDCASANGSEAQTACAAYLMGMVHGLQIGTLFTKRRKPFCIPESVKSPQAIQMFNKAAAESSEMVKEPADLLWIMTLSSAFPCSKSK